MSTSTAQLRNQATTPPHADLRVRLLVIAITAGAAALRLAHLGSSSFWQDEIVSVAIARLDWAGFRKVITNHEANMSLYYLLLKLWTYLGSSEFFIRTLSAAAAIATVWLVYRIGTEWFSRRVGLIAATLLAVNSFHIRYAQEARSYALVALLIAASTWYFSRFVEQPTATNRRWFIAASVMALYSHFFALLALVAQAVSLAARRHQPVPWRALRKSYAIIGLCFLPLAWFITFKNSGQIGWLPPLSAGEVYRLVYNFAGRSNALLGIYGALTVISAVSSMRRRPQPERWRTALLWAWFLVPIALVITASFRKPLLLPRFLIICLPAFVLIAATGLERLWPRWSILPVLAVIVALGVRADLELYAHRFDPPDQDWRGATAYIVQHARSGDALIVFHPFLALDVEYYRTRLHAPPDVPQLVFPLRGDGVMLYSVKPIDSTLLRAGTPLMVRVVSEHPRVWLVLTTDGPPVRNLTGFLREHYRESEHQNFGEGADVYLYSR